MYRCDGKKTIEECLHCHFPDCVASPASLLGDAMPRKIYDRNRKRELYEKRKMLGICATCGKAPAVTGYIQCEACRARMAAYRAKEREKKETARHE